jgi:hypothetical protein
MESINNFFLSTSLASDSAITLERVFPGRSNEVWSFAHAVISSIKSCRRDVIPDGLRHHDAILLKTFEAVRKKSGANVAVMDGRRHLFNLTDAA